jgi:hypothetical protein
MASSVRAPSCAALFSERIVVEDHTLEAMRTRGFRKEMRRRLLFIHLKLL